MLPQKLQRLTNTLLRDVSSSQEVVRKPFDLKCLCKVRIVTECLRGTHDLTCIDKRILVPCQMNRTHGRTSTTSCVLERTSKTPRPCSRQSILVSGFSELPLMDEPASSIAE